MLVNTTRINIRPENRREFFQTVLSLLVPIRSEKGCLAYHCYVELTDENSAILISEWQGQEDWDNHLKSNDFCVLLGAVKVLAIPTNNEFTMLWKPPGTETLAIGNGRLT